MQLSKMKTKRYKAITPTVEWNFIYPMTVNTTNRKAIRDVSPPTDRLLSLDIPTGESLLFKTMQPPVDPTDRTRDGAKVNCRIQEHDEPTQTTGESL